MRWPFSKLRLAGSKVDPGTYPMVFMGAAPNLKLPEWRPSGPFGGSDSLPVDPQNTSDLALTERHFRRDLPRLLEQGEKLGKWVLYSAQGFVAEDADQDQFYRKYGKEIGTRYFLARIQPERRR
jgi:hypothetical protein